MKSLDVRLLLCYHRQHDWSTRMVFILCAANRREARLCDYDNPRYCYGQWPVQCWRCDRISVYHVVRSSLWQKAEHPAWSLSGSVGGRFSRWSCCFSVNTFKKSKSAPAIRTNFDQGCSKWEESSQVWELVFLSPYVRCTCLRCPVPTFADGLWGTMRSSSSLDIPLLGGLAMHATLLPTSMNLLHGDFRSHSSAFRPLYYSSALHGCHVRHDGCCPKVMLTRHGRCFRS